MERKIVVGITQGDINGIGLEVIIKTFLDPAMLELCTPVLFSSQKTASYHRKALGIEDFSFMNLKGFDSINHKKANLYNCYQEEANIELGKSTETGGLYAYKSLGAASEALEKGFIDALITAPINKHNIQSEQFPYPGHTEYFTQKFGLEKGSLMLMVSEMLKMGVVTGHIPLSEVASAISTDKIVDKISVLNKTLTKDFAIRKPRIAVLGLNPHAGDNGTLGKEEQEIIIPAINKAKEKNILAFGPYSADGFFGAGTYTQFDAVLAMYHDQGLIPFKTLSFNAGVNYTAGLSIIRTSPDHGTAYELAGKNTASESSFRNAVYLACDIFRTRNQFKEISANPLEAAPMKKDR